MTGRPPILRAAAATVVAALLALLGPAAVPAGAQDGEVPTQDIIPEPNSGEAPDDAGDRGGGLQLAVFGLVVVSLLGGGAYVAHQSRRARSALGQAPASDARMASQAPTPSMKPDR